MNNKALLAIVLISTLLLISGCSKKECETKTDCVAKKGICIITSCVKGVCNYPVKEGCTCGDFVCDAKTENSCNCADDCKKSPCKGSVGKYLEKKCDEKQECVTMLVEANKEKPEDIEDTIELLDVKTLMASLLVNYKYDKPFNVDSSLLAISIKIDKKQDSVTKLTVKKIKLIEHTGTFDAKTKLWKNDQAKTLVENDYNRQLWNSQTDLSDGFPITVEDDINASENKKLWVSIEIEYVIVDSRGNEKINNYEYSKELEFELVDPTVARQCPPRTGWDDGNPCTTEKCLAETNFFVEHEMKRGCKGNFICETGENGCNSPKDCEPCEKDIGLYLERVCYNLECKTKIKGGVRVETISIPDTRIMGITTFLVRSSFNKPFNINKDKFTLQYEVQKLGEAQGFTITTVQLIDKGRTQSLIVDQKVDVGFSSVGSTQTITLVPLAQLSSSIVGEEIRRPSLKVFYKYYTLAPDGKQQETIASYEQDLGDITFLNPEVEI